MGELEVGSQLKMPTLVQQEALQQKSQKESPTHIRRKHLVRDVGDYNSNVSNLHR